MALGPIEVLAVGFPGNEFNGGILPALERLVEDGTITVVDGLLARKDAGGVVTFAEFGELEPDQDIARLAGMLRQVDSLISDDDVERLAGDLEPNSSAAIFVFEHTWAKPLRDAVVDSGGVLLADFRVPGLAVEQLLAELEASDIATAH